MKGNFVLYKILNQYQFYILPINIGTKSNNKKNARVFINKFNKFNLPACIQHITHKC
jgi:hypothetical protein